MLHIENESLMTCLQLYRSECGKIVNQILQILLNIRLGKKTSVSFIFLENITFLLLPVFD
jgi:hypothetical protein